MVMTNKTKGNLLILITALLWSTGGLLLKHTSGHPLAINGARSLIAFIFFIIYKRSIKIRINKYIVLAAICLSGTTILFVAANQLTTAGSTIVLQYISPILVLIWDSIYYHKKPSTKQVCFVLLAFMGMVLFFFDQLDPSKLVGNLLAILSGFTFSGVFFINSLPEGSGEDSSMLGFIISIVVSIPFITKLDYSNHKSLIAIFVIGIFQVGLAYVFFSKGTKLTTPVNASLIGLIEAIANPMWVYMFYGEALGKFALIGGSMIMLSVMLNILFTRNNDI